MSLVRLDASGAERCRVEAEVPLDAGESTVAVTAAGDALAAGSLHGGYDSTQIGLALLALPH